MRSVTATILAAAMIAAGAGEAAFAAAGCRAIDGKPRFEIVGEVARDRASGLEWKRCSVGATWSGTACEGEAASLTLDEAEAAAKAAGDDWRLPDVKELYELIDDDCGKPPADVGAFPDVRESDLEGAGAWTSTPVGLAELWFYVDLGSGVADGHSRDFRISARLVRSKR
ncbi:MAG: DUF1566 domain-containing protein [Siculibacillus sp.]